MRRGKARSVTKGRRKRDISKPAPLPANARAFIEALQSSGRYVFTKEEAHRALRLSDIALKNALWRLVRSGRVASHGEGSMSSCHRSTKRRGPSLPHGSFGS